MKLSDVSVCKDDNTSPIRINQAVLKPWDIPPLSAYYALRDLFGPPNYDDFDDTKSQWAYYLQVPGARLEIYDWKLESWSIAVHTDTSEAISKELTYLHDTGASGADYGRRMMELHSHDNDAQAENIGKAFLELLRKHAMKFSGKIDEAAKGAKRFVLQNPFALYYSSANSLLDKARKNDNKSADYCRAVFFLFVAAFEGLLNLVYELYAKSELRDERIYERLARDQIDIKVRLAPLYCTCFSNEPIDYRSDIFKRFHSIANLRNDFIHANVTKPMKTPIVIEDGHTFMVEPSIRDKDGLPKSIAILDTNDIQVVKDSVDQMVALLVEAMQPRFRHEFKAILGEDYVPVLIEDGELIVDVGE